MKRAVLPSGLTVLYENHQGNSVVIQVLVKVGSNDEKPTERGIAHFLEHILFEGTAKRPTNQLISNEIERIGGEFNAYTTGDKTCFYIKVLKKHFNIALDILADILQNSVFKPEFVEKEKNIVLKEIDMVNDEPRFYQWLLLQKNLFVKHPCKFPTYGDRKIIKNLTREQVMKFYSKHYIAKNMVISIVGGVPNWKSKVQKAFTLNGGTVPKRVKYSEPLQKKNRTVREKKSIVNSYLLLGFKTVSRKHKDSVVLEVINGILGRGQSGRLFNEIRSKRALAYDVGSQNVSEKTFGYFATYSIIDTKNIELVKKLVLAELKKLQHVNETDIKESKTFIEGDYLIGLEEVQKRADEMLFWEQIGDAKELKTYISKVKKVTVADVKRVANKYFNNYTMTVLQGK